MKVLIIDDVSSLLINGLTQKGFEVTYLPNITRAELLTQITLYNILVVRTKTPIDSEILHSAKNLKIIARAGSGLDNIDTVLAEQMGIMYFNAGGANADAVGEHALAMLLNLLRNIQKAHAEVTNGLWNRESNRGVELNGKTIGIIGFGNTGKAFAKKLSGFDVKVLAYDKYLKNYSNPNAQEASLTEIFEQADILSLHIPLTFETQNWINDNFILQFKKNIFLINTCRGEVVNMHEIIDCLKVGKLRGACFDVLPNEKLNSLSNQQQKDFDYLINTNNVVLSPHIAGWTFESYEKIAQTILLKLTDLK